MAKSLVAMEPKNAQNFEIFLLSINIRTDVLIKAIREMDVKVFTLEMISKIIYNVPDPDKLVKLELYKTKTDVRFIY